MIGHLVKTPVPEAGPHVHGVHPLSPAEGHSIARWIGPLHVQVFPHSVKKRHCCPSQGTSALAPSNPRATPLSRPCSKLASDCRVKRPSKRHLCSKRFSVPVRWPRPRV